MPDIRKLVYLREESFAEAGRVAPRPIIRAVALILIGNPFAGRFVEDLSPLVEFGPTLAARVAPELVKLLGGPAVSYGKGAIVGAAGELEHGAAILHPALGRPLREAIGAGAAIFHLRPRWADLAARLICRWGIRMMSGRAGILTRSP